MNCHSCLGLLVQQNPSFGQGLVQLMLQSQLPLETLLLVIHYRANLCDHSWVSQDKIGSLHWTIFKLFKSRNEESLCLCRNRCSWEAWSSHPLERASSRKHREEQQPIIGPAGNPNFKIRCKTTKESRIRLWEQRWRLKQRQTVTALVPKGMLLRRKGQDKVK